MRSHRRGLTWLALMALVLILGAVATAQEKQWWPFPVEDRDPPFDMEGKKIKNQYTPLLHAAKKWNICVSFPHMKDAYWTAVDYGVVAESKRLGVKMQLVEAGGYTNLPKQISQIEDCVSQGANAVVIGAISETGLNKLIEEIRAKGTPVIDVINGISSPQLSAKSLVSFGEMGAKAGEYLVKMHPKGAKPVKVAWFPGPPGAGWVVAGNKGFVEAAPTDSAVIQGRIAIDQAVRILEHKPYTKHTGPAIYVIDKANINSFHYESSLAPPDFKPTFSVD